MLPETLPGRNDVNFLSHLQLLTPDSHSLTKLSGISHDQREERAVHLIWCPIVCYTNPYKQLPACIYITTENVHILEVVSLKGDSGFPEMDHIYCVPLMNIKQIVLGYQSQYIRIEEAFVGPQGTYSLLTGSQNKTDLFLDSLKLAYRRAIPDLDQYEDPHIVVNGETDFNMKQTLNKVQMLNKASSIDAVLYMLVQSVDLSNPKKPFMTFSLVITHNYLYLLREDYILWPQPTFGIGPSMRPQFEIASVFPIMGRITGIQMYDSDTYSPDQDISMSQNFSATNISAMVVPKFIGFGVKLTFDLGYQGAQDLDVRVSTSGMRDKFLATLTQVRKERSERSPNLIKSKSKVKVKDVDGDNLSTSSSNSGHGGARSKVRPEKKQSKREHEPTLPSHRHEPSSSQIRYNTIDPPYEEIDPMCVLNGTHPDPDSQDASRNDSLDPCEAMDFSNLPKRESPTGESSTTVESLAIDRLDAPVPVIPQIRRTPPPNSLNVGQYPSMKLLGQLTESNESMNLLVPLSAPLQNLASMTGEEILNFFHSNIAQIGVGSEEVKHLLWSSVIPYVTPLQELPVCMILSTKAIYFVSDKVAKIMPARLPHKHLKTHARHRSDSYKVVKQDQNVGELQHMGSSGILHDSSNSGEQKFLRTYHVLNLKDIQEVHMGFFDQTFRLTGSRPEDVLACITRDNNATETFLKHLMEALSALNITPSPDVGNTELEQDFYKMFNKYQRTESLEFTHPSKVRFIYPSDDSITELTYLVTNSIKGKKPKVDQVSMLLYLLLYQMDSLDGSSEVDTSKGKSRTVVLTDEHIAIATEDHVSYPLPHFTKSIPEQPQMDILEVRNVEFLKRIVVSDFTSHDITLVFTDETDEVVVDSSVEYFSPKEGTVDGESEQTGEVAWHFVVQNSKDKDRLIKCLSRQWAEKHDGEELSVQVSA